MLMKMATAKEVEDLRNQFKGMDKDGTGMITAAELKKAIVDKQMNMSQNDI